MKKIKLKIVWVLVWMFLLSWVVYAVDYYRDNHWIGINIDKHNTSYHNNCYHIHNNSSSVNYFIPVKTSTEWSAFRSHLPSWVVKYQCFNQTVWHMWHIKDDSNHIEICYHWRCRDWYPSWDVTTRTSVHVFGRTFRRWRLAYTTGTWNQYRKYYYLNE